MGSLLRPAIKLINDWSKWAWFSTTNPNRHTFSLLHFQCTSHYSENHGSDVSLCPHFCPKPVILCPSHAVLAVLVNIKTPSASGGLLSWQTGKSESRCFTVRPCYDFKMRARVCFCSIWGHLWEVTLTKHSLSLLSCSVFSFPIFSLCVHEVMSHWWELAASGHSKWPHPNLCIRFNIIHIS